MVEPTRRNPRVHACREDFRLLKGYLQARAWDEIDVGEGLFVPGPLKSLA